MTSIKFYISSSLCNASTAVTFYSHLHLSLSLTPLRDSLASLAASRTCSAKDSVWKRSPHTSKIKIGLNWLIFILFQLQPLKFPEKRRWWCFFSKFSKYYRFVNECKFWILSEGTFYRYFYSTRCLVKTWYYDYSKGMTHNNTKNLFETHWKMLPVKLTSFLLRKIFFPLENKMEEKYFLTT